MNLKRVCVGSTLLIALLIVGCQQPAPSPDPGPHPDPNMVAQKAARVKMVASGRNAELTYKAPQAGQLYIIDSDTGLYIYNAPLASGEKFVFAPASSRATIDKQTVDLIRGTNENDEYRMYFLPQ
jgi:hypothetical protein